MANLKIRLFGAPTIELNGQLVDPGRRRVIALAAYLSASDAPQSRAGICAMLWPEKSAAIARAELRRSISTLRSCIGPRFVETTRSTVALSPDASVDIREFRAFLESSIAHPGIEDAQCPDCIRALETAVALYRGDFLDGLSIPDSSAFDDWQIFEAERLRESLNHALERLSRPVSSADERPRESTALEYAHRWVRMDNLNEAAHRRLMILYAIDGQRGAALRQYAACEKILGEELGALPDRKTAELKKKIGAGPLGFELAAVSRDEIGATPRTSTVGRIGSKNRRRRTQTMVVLAFALVAATIGVAYAIRPVVVGDSPGIPIAVIPLVDHSSDTRNKWFVDGMTEAIITNLARIRALRVTSHSSVDALADGHPSISEIRRRLGVDYVVEGSVLKAEGRVRITAQLIDARTDQHRWADEYESELTDIIRLQARIAWDIASQVSDRVSTREKNALTRVESVDPEAYEAYLLGAYELARLPFDIGNSWKCLADLKRSIGKDGTYAPAHAALANYYWGATQFGFYSNNEGMKLATAEAERAVALDEHLSEGHTVLGFVRFLHDFDWQLSEREFRRAIALKPSSAEAHCWYGSLLCTLGRFNEAITEVKKARDIDPLSLMNILNVAMRLYYARDFDEAVKQATIARDMENGFYMSHLVLGYALAANGALNEAVAELETAASLAGEGAMEPLALLSCVYSRAGRESEADSAGRRFEALESKGISLSPLLRAYIPLGRGQLGAAMDLIEQSYVDHDLNLAWNFQDPIFDPLRALPRFKELKKKLKL